MISGERIRLAVMAEVFGKDAAESVKRSRGRPLKDDRKVNQTLPLDPDMLDAYRHEGSGWQARINEALREHTPKRSR